MASKLGSFWGDPRAFRSPRAFISGPLGGVGEGRGVGARWSKMACKPPPRCHRRRSACRVLGSFLWAKKCAAFRGAAAKATPLRMASFNLRVLSARSKSWAAMASSSVGPGGSVLRHGSPACGRRSPACRDHRCILPAADRELEVPGVWGAARCQLGGAWGRPWGCSMGPEVRRSGARMSPVGFGAGGADSGLGSAPMGLAVGPAWGHIQRPRQVRSVNSAAQWAR